MKRLVAASAVALALVACNGCKGISAPTGPEVEAGAGVASGLCSYIEGVDDSQVVRIICATVDEIAQIAEFVLMLRTSQDAGAPDAAACKPLPGSTVCATSAERAKGVLFITHVRARRLMLDGGAR